MEEVGLGSDEDWLGKIGMEMELRGKTPQGARKVMPCPWKMQGKFAQSLRYVW